MPLNLEEESDEPVYDVEKIVDKKTERGVIKYFVKWKSKNHLCK